MLLASAGLMLLVAVPAHADLCVIVDPLLDVGDCRPTDSGGGAGQAQSAREEQQEAVEQPPTSVVYDRERIAVTVERGASREQIARAFASARVQVERAVPQIRAYLLRVAADRQADAVRELRASRVVAHAGPEVLSYVLDTEPNDGAWPAQDGLRVVGLPRAWSTSRGSPRVVVAVIDTGVDAGQPDLTAALVGGLNLVDPSGPPVDDNGHGTAVAGIVAARADNGEGMAGVCWLCLVMPVKVLDRTGVGFTTAIAAGIVWAVDHGARIVNLSLGGPADTPELAAALAYAAEKGAVVVAAAGNNGSTTLFYPAADVNALSVAATTNSDRVYGWSSFGGWVNVAAPGCNVAPALEGGYETFCGTSSATPIVSGLAALALSTRPGASPAVVRRAIADGALPLPGFVQFGRVDAPKTLAVLGPPRVARVFRGKVGPAQRARRAYAVQSNPGLFSATLRFARGMVAAVTLESLEDGARLARRAGRSPLRISRQVPGAVRVVVRGAAGRTLRFVLRVSFTERAP